jgi:flagellar biosynthesis protein FlhF
MKIRRFKGPNRAALYRAIQDEMGPNAVVVAPEEDSGKFRLGRAKPVELIAILDDSAASPGAAPLQTTDDSRADTDLGQELQRLRQQQTRQWRDMDVALQDIRKAMGSLSESREGTASWVPAYARDWDPRFCVWARNAKPALLDPDAPPSGTLWAEALAARLPMEAAFSFRKKDAKPHVIVLVGPTGSGKTTTLAKLAAICALQEKLRIGLITTDTFRVAAVDQLREYASLLDAELHVVFSSGEAHAAVEALAAVDVILVDTPGRTHLDDMGLASMHNVLRGMGPASVFLTLPASLSRVDLADVLKGFSRFQPKHFIVTKVDETRSPVIFTSLPFETERTLAFVTNGQQVPHDIFTPNANRIAALLTHPHDFRTLSD